MSEYYCDCGAYTGSITMAPQHESCCPRHRKNLAQCDECERYFTKAEMVGELCEYCAPAIEEAS